MNSNTAARPNSSWPTLARFPLPAKVLVTMIILTLSVAMLGALGQIIVHDIIPTFRQIGMVAESEEVSDAPEEAAREPAAGTGGGRGDLFGEAAPTASRPEPRPFYKDEQFVWTLKWTHIHLFGMNMIFIFVGIITLFLDLGNRTRTWLIGLPFVGVLVDIATMWLKGYISPHFFWLHLPGGGLFGVIFAYVSIRALWEMWLVGRAAAGTH